MKLKSKFLVAGISTFMLGTFFLPLARNQKTQIEPDNLEYEQPLVVSYDHPDDVYNAHQAASKWPDIVKINYHNDNGGCDQKAFYFWFSGVNGKQYAPDLVSDDKKDMSITVDFSTETFKAGYHNKMYMIVKGSTLNDWSDKTDDTPIDYSQFTIENDGSMSIWAIPGEGSALELYDTKEETKMDKILTATFKNDWKTILVKSTIAPTSYKVYALTGSYYALNNREKEAFKERYLIKTGNNPECQNVEYNKAIVKSFSIPLNFTVKINVQYQVTAYFSTKPEKEQTKFVASDALYETKRFEDYYNYNGNDLGVTYTPSATTFKVWAPTATRMRLCLYDSGSSSDYDGGSDDYRGYNMVYQPGGIWQVTIDKQNLNGRYYNYTVYNSLGTNTVVDPYAHACGINGERGMVLNFASTNPTDWDKVGEALGTLNSPNELTIYESHIRDLTMDETWQGTNKRGTFLAYIEPGTTYSDGTTTVTTGFDHLVEMGVNAVQLTPVFDHDDDETDKGMHYNWGYNPLNYNCVEGGYSTNPYDGKVRISEFKQLVKALANNGNHTRTIMDVVYNHVSSAPASNFNKLMPKYYFRLTEEGFYYNGSGCGNEVKTEAPMMRKFIVDSLCWWASEYKIKGFRFDLMGLIDWKTLDLARTELYKIDPSIYLYGEGWTGDSSESGHVNEAYYGTWGSNTWTVYNKLPTVSGKCIVGAFNDRGRNSLKGENDYDKQDKYWGFINQDSDHVGDKSYAIADMLAGYHDSGDNKWMDPYQSISYASCHDNFTLFDQMMVTTGVLSDDHPGSTMAAVSAIECTILMSNGVAFIQGGEELFRHKAITEEDDLEVARPSDYITFGNQKISHNSYNLSDDVNAFRWDRKISVDGVKSSGYVEAIEKAIATRKQMAKYSKAQLASASPFASSSPFNIWNRANKSTTLGMKNGDYFFFIAGCNSDFIPFAAINSMNYNNPTFCSNVYYQDGVKKYGYSYHLSDNEEMNNGTVTLGWYTCVCFLAQ